MAKKRPEDLIIVVNGEVVEPVVKVKLYEKIGLSAARRLLRQKQAEYLAVRRSQNEQ